MAWFRIFLFKNVKANIEAVQKFIRALDASVQLSPSISLFATQTLQASQKLPNLLLDSMFTLGIVQIEHLVDVISKLLIFLNLTAQKLPTAIIFEIARRKIDLSNQFQSNPDYSIKRDRWSRLIVTSKSFEDRHPGTLEFQWHSSQQYGHPWELTNCNFVAMP